MKQKASFDLPFLRGLSDGEEVEVIGSLRICSARSESGGGRTCWKLVSAFPSLSCSPLLICRTRTLRLQPCSTAARRYHFRRSASLSRSRRTMWWPQGNSAATCCTICFSGHASANDRIYLRLRGLNPSTPGNSLWRSWESRSITRVPQPSVPCRARMSWPIDQ